MTTEAKAPPQAEDLKLLAEQIFSAKNHRELDSNSPEMKELVESIKVHGLIQPLSVKRTQDPSTFELIAGARRFHAATKAKLSGISVRVYPADLSDEEADLIRAAENLDRKPLNAIEEANAINTVFLRTSDIKTVAGAVNKTVAYVTRALSLLSLPEKIQKLIGEAKLTAAHGHHIMRVAEKQRPSLVEFVTTKNYHQEYPTVAELARQIAARVERDLEKAPFPKDVEYAGEVSCAKCPLNTANQGSLFDGATKGGCTGPLCFAKKERLFYKEFEEKQGAKLEKLQALGVTKGADYNGNIKGHKVLSKADLKNKTIQKAMAESPQAFGFAVVKADKWSGASKPKVALVVVDPTVLPKAAQPKAPTPSRDWEKERHIDGFVEFALVQAAAKKFDPANPKKSLVEGMVLRGLFALEPTELFQVLSSIYDAKEVEKLEADGPALDKNVDKFVRKMSRPELLHVLFVLSFRATPSDEIEQAAKDVGVDVKKIITEARKAATEAWDAEKKSQAEKEAAEKAGQPAGEKE